MKTLKAKLVVYVFVIWFLVLPLFLSPVFSADLVQPQTNNFSNLASLSGAGFCEENGLESIYNENNVFEKSGSLQSLIFTVLSMLNGCYGKLASGDASGTGIREIKGGLLSTLSGVTGTIYSSPPASLAWQVDNTIDNLSPTKETIAADRFAGGLYSGASLLSIIYDLHRAVLNIVLVFFIFIFIAIGGAMIFRNKLGGQEYVTIINSIPRVVIALILVVFSFPISGLIIDIGNVGYGLVYDIFVNRIRVTSEEYNISGSFLNTAKDETLFEQLLPTSTKMSVWQVFGYSSIPILKKGAPNINFVPIDLGEDGGFNAISTLGNIIKGITGDVGLGGQSFSVLLVVILSLGAVISMFKILFALIKDYLTMLFYPVFSPFSFAMYALPGQDKQIVNYIKTLLGAVLSFVAVYAVFMLIIFLGRNFLVTDPASTLPNNPPLLGLIGDKTTSTVSLQLITGIAGYGLFVLAASVPDMVKNAIGAGAGSFSKYASQIGETTKSGIRRIPIVGSFV